MDKSDIKFYKVIAETYTANDDEFAKDMPVPTEFLDRLRELMSNKLYEEQLNEIENRIRSYVLENEGKTLNIEGNNIKLDIYKENTTINIPISFLITEGVLEKYPINPKCGKKIEGYYTLKVTVPGTYILEYHMSNSEETFCKV